MSHAASTVPATPLPDPTVRARHWQAMANGIVRCKMEPRQCEVGEGERGVCGVRENRGGVYYSRVYGLPSAVQVAPVEENFVHALPGSKVLQIGTAGCNLQCKFCNTWQISQTRPEETAWQRVSPQQAVEMALKQGCKSVCFTYNDPVVCLEYVVDTAVEARKNGLKALCHTAGLIHDEPLIELCNNMDSIVVDLKGTTKQLYRQVCGLEMEEAVDRVYATAWRIFKSKAALEIATPVIPGLTDTKVFGTAVAKWIGQNLSPDVPWQLYRFFPAYQMQDVPATGMTVLRGIQDAAVAAGLHHVYLCNLARTGDSSVVCPKCKKKLIDRNADQCANQGLESGKCNQCGQAIYGVWQ